MTHVPIGYEAIAVWTDAFNALVDRYKNTISAVFSAHSHSDEVRFHPSLSSTLDITAV
jgi:hypothetical protein